MNMLYLLMGILKIAGFLLLALLLLAVFLVVSVLAVPVRYRLALIRTEEQCRGEIRLTWLLHLVSISLAFDARQKARRLQIRILGIRPEAVIAFWRKRKKKKEPITDTEQKETGGRAKSELPDKNSVNDRACGSDDSADRIRQSPEAETPAYHDGHDRDEDSVREADPDQEEASGQDGKSKAAQMTDQGRASDSEEGFCKEKESAEPGFGKEEESAENGFCEEAESTEEYSAEQKNAGRFPGGLSRRLTALLQRIRQTLYQIRRFLTELSGTIQRLLQKPGRVYEQIEVYRKLYDEYEMSAAIGDLTEVVRRLLRHYRPRSGSGYVHFGTGDPALTGQLAGMLYLILPLSLEKVELKPEFTQTLFQTELTLKGRIRSVHMACAAFRLYRNRRLRRLFSGIRRRRFRT